MTDQEMYAILESWVESFEPDMTGRKEYHQDWGRDHDPEDVWEHQIELAREYLEDNIEEPIDDIIPGFTVADPEDLPAIKAYVIRWFKEA